MAVIFSIHSDCLQQLYIDSTCTDLPDSLMSTISAHGVLLHVVLFVRSLTGKGITVHVRNSPNLLTFHAVVEDELCHHTGVCTRVDPNLIETGLKRKHPKRQLFIVGSYKVKIEKGKIRAQLDLFLDHQCRTDYGAFVIVSV